MGKKKKIILCVRNISNKGNENQLLHIAVEMREKRNINTTFREKICQNHANRNLTCEQKIPQQLFFFYLIKSFYFVGEFYL